MRRTALAAAGLLLVAGCGAAKTASVPFASVTPDTSSAAPLATPSGPITPTAGESAAAVWSRRGVTPAPPAGFLDAYAALPLPVAATNAPDAAAYVRAAVRELSGDTYATDHLRLDLVDSGVLGVTGLAGDDTSIIQAENAGLASTDTTLRAVLAAAVLKLSPAQAKDLDDYVVVLRLQYGPTVGTYTDGTSKTLPAGAPVSQAVAGHLVTSPLLGTYLYVTSATDCTSAVKGSASAQACALLS
jgi:hypothetical protein